VIAELGQVALILALLLALVQASLPLIGSFQGRADWMALARPAALAQSFFVALAFGLLAVAFVMQDFSLAYVAQHSNLRLPPHYRISAVWGAHEGSLLLWVLVLGAWTSVLALASRRLPLPFMARVLSVLGIVSVGFIAFTLFTSNPFLRHLPPLLDGNDLNPLLQDFGLIVHPPMLYLGYVGFAVPFAFAVAALIEGRVDAEWVRWSRPWTLVAWSFLTIGIALGSWWAYYELGWGGWWFWDPVENASFMPWLIGTALIHSQAVTDKRGSFRAWTLLLAIFAFSLSLLGTFLVRSGVLTSVHAFASDPARGLYILVFLAFVSGGALTLYAVRAPRLNGDSETPFGVVSRESLLLSNNLLLASACALVLIGTLFPLLADAFGWGKFSVGPAYFGPYFFGLMAPLVLLLPFGPLARWQQADAAGLWRLLRWSALAALAAGALAWIVWREALGWKGALGIVGGAWLALGVVAAWRARAVSPRDVVANPTSAPNRRLNAGFVGMLVAHAGMAMFVTGVLLTESSSIEKDVRLAPGESLTVRDLEFRFVSVASVNGPNYQADRGQFEVWRNDRRIAVMQPEKRLYSGGSQIMTEAAIDAGFTRDLYVALGEPLRTADGGNSASQPWAVRIYHKPFMRWVWLGAVLMMLGGATAATDRRYRRQRVAAPALREPMAHAHLAVAP